MLKLGSIALDVPFFQAPLSGYSDRPMRVLARQYGCPLTFTGVMLDKIALHPAAMKKLVFQPGDDEYPVGAQILGSDAETMARSAAAFEQVGYDLIDLNFACPAPKVLRRGRGGALLQKPATVREIYQRVRDAVKCPVLMKLRVGFDSGPAAQEDFQQICADAAGLAVDALVIHGRTVTQRYRGTADWEIVTEIKRKYPSMTILGSGDLMTSQTVVSRLKTSGLDGVIIARGAIGNPWIFAESRALLAGEPAPEKPSLAEQGRVMLRHFEMILELRPMHKAIRYFRKFSASYCKRHPQRKKVKLALMAAKEANELQATIKKWYGLG